MRLRMWFLRGLILFFGIGFPMRGRAQASNNRAAPPRPVAIADGIGMTRLADDDYFSGAPADGRVAHFSPDRKQFVIVLRRGDLTNNTNEFTLLHFRTQTALREPTPDVLLKLCSSSNHDGIREVRWLNNETITLVGETPGEPSQVYAVDTSSKRIRFLTNHATSVLKYDMTADGHEIVFSAEMPHRRMFEATSMRRDGTVIEGQDLPDLLADEAVFSQDVGLYLLKSNAETVQLPVDGQLTEASPLSLSPDGRYVVVGVNYRGPIPETWKDYNNEYIQEMTSNVWRKDRVSRLHGYRIVDLSNLREMPLLNAPMLLYNRLRWAADAQSVIVQGTYLPLDPTDIVERQARQQNRYDVRIRIPILDFQKIAPRELPSVTPQDSDASVTLEENVNSPPRIYIRDLKTNKKSLLLDLNPQFEGLDLGKVEVIHWNGTDGQTSEGGLYLPSNFASGRRYPLVIQTHGFRPDLRFSMDGFNDWSSAFAARPLASAGFIVLQTAQLSTNRVEEGPREMARYQGAIDYLDSRGLIDRERVGIIGFSRTTYHVAYTLTHSRYRFAAAVLVDGVDGGYFQNIAFGPGQDVQVNGGHPFGEGLSIWLRNSPGFNLDKVEPPVRLVALGRWSILEMWEWFSGLSQLNRPVELIDLPDAPHLLVKPWECQAAQEGLVDWFRFWLKTEEDSDPAKIAQYARWHKLRKQLVERESR